MHKIYTFLMIRHLIYSSNLLEHIPDINCCLSECFRVLKPTGIMIHIMPTRLWKFFYFFLAPFRFQCPRIHGAFSSHISEFYNYRKNNWIKKFNRNGFKVSEIHKMPFYVGHSNHFIPLIKLGNALKWSATLVYVTSKCFV